MKYRHYAPKADVFIADGSHMNAKIDKALTLISASTKRQQKTALFCSRTFIDCLDLPNSPLEIKLDENLLSTDRSDEANMAAVYYGQHSDARAAGASLFAALRLFDAWGAAIIIAEGLSNEPEADAYMNRLEKAASARQEDTGENNQDERPKKKILFVCTGNTCRSPMAASLFNKLRTDSVWTAESAGVAAFSGDPISPGARQVLSDRYQIDASRHEARPVTTTMIQEADLVLTMTSQHRDLLRRAFPAASGKISGLAEFAGLAGQEISDPFGGPISTYEQTASEIEEFICRILPKLTRFADF